MLVNIACSQHYWARIQYYSFTTSLVRAYPDSSLHVSCHLSEAAISTHATLTRSEFWYLLIANEDSKVLSSSMIYWTKGDVLSLWTVVPVIWRFRTKSPFCKCFHKIAFKNVFRFLGNFNDLQHRTHWKKVTAILIHSCSFQVYMKEVRNLGHPLNCKDSVRNGMVVILRHAKIMLET